MVIDNYAALAVVFYKLEYYYARRDFLKNRLLAVADYLLKVALGQKFVAQASRMHCLQPIVRCYKYQLAVDA